MSSGWYSCACFVSVWLILDYIKQEQSSLLSPWKWRRNTACVGHFGPLDASGPKPLSTIVNREGCSLQVTSGFPAHAQDLLHSH